MGKRYQMPHTLLMSQKLELLSLKSQRPHQRKIRCEKIKTIIKAVITPTKATHAIETQVTALALQDLIVQQIDKNTTPVPDAAVYHTISVDSILH